MKICRVCKEKKNLCFFSQNKRKNDNLNDECKECQKAYFKEYYKNNKEKHIKRVDKTEKYSRYLLWKYKLEKGCCKCGYNKCPNALHFHHKDPSIKEYTISQNYHLDWNILLKEIEKCEVICANCHAEEHFNHEDIEKFNFKPKKTSKRVKIKKIRENIYKNLCECGKEKCKISIKCNKCNYKDKSDIPPKEELESLIWKIPSTKIAKKYNVSDRQIKNWCEKYKISKPPRGYWTKIK